MARAVKEELEKRHLGHKYIPSEDRKPLFSMATLGDVKDSNLRTASVTQQIETLYDDLSMDRVLYTTEAD